MRAYPAELMHHGETAENGEVSYLHMPSQLYAIGEYRIVSHLAIMRHVYIGHDPVVVTDLGNTMVLNSSAIERAKLPYRISVADFQSRGLACVFLVLWHFSQRDKLKYPVIASDTRMAGDNRVRAHTAASIYFHMFTDQRIRADLYALGEASAGMDDGRGMYHEWVSG
jgi:hypothetical protein